MVSKYAKTPLSDYEKSVLHVATQIYVENVKETQKLPEEQIPVLDEIMGEAIIEAVDLVDAALELCRG